jgi:hypothetical protein
LPLSWNEIKDRAPRFSREWKGEGSERAEVQSFWDGFFDVFGVACNNIRAVSSVLKLPLVNTNMTASLGAFWRQGSTYCKTRMILQ